MDTIKIKVIDNQYFLSKDKDNTYNPITLNFIMDKKIPR
jgi:hypothetical protein